MAMTAPLTDTLPPLTDDLLAQMRAFGRGNLFAVRIKRAIKSKAHNVIIPAGAITWASETAPFPGDEDNGFITVWTGHTHYAGVKSSTISPSKVERLEDIPEVLL